MVISISIEELTIIEETQNRKDARIVSNDLSGILNEVNIQNEGYSRSYTLPSKINQETYIVKINHSGVYINSHYQITYSKIIPSNKLASKNFILIPGNTYKIINNNESIDIIQLN
ncbi:hypothetical protein [Methanosphaera sp. WGK6]|uniref:hypothetical protein n=1 Tax=Methanosphaera sp. WGK6 TaxID=1561964 RepID=UPI00117E1EB1|nr:hypothetical protein [Methanosphaera sp. WGK6]